MRKFISQLLPFLFLGIALVALAFGIFLLAYLFFFGALVGVVLYTVSWLRTKFFPPPKTIRRTKDNRGRVIDSDDWKEL